MQVHLLFAEIRESAINIQFIKLQVVACVRMSAVNTKIPVMGIQVERLDDQPSY